MSTNYLKIMSIMDSGKDLEDCIITGNKLKYTNHRIKLNAAFTHMKSLFTGPHENMDDQIFILQKCFGPKGLKTPVGKIVFGKEFNDILTPGIIHAMRSSFTTVYNQIFGKYNNSELFEVTRRYVKVKGKYMIGTASKLRPPQIMCLRSAILGRSENFHKKACIMMNPEYVPENDTEITDLLDKIEVENAVTTDLTEAIKARKLVAVTTMDKIMASCR